MLVRCTVLCCSTAALCGAEFVLREGSLALLVPPSEFEWELDSAVINDAGNDSFTAGSVLDLGARWSWSRPGSAWGLIYGADLLLWGQAYGTGDGLAMMAGRICAGGGYAPSDRWTLTAEVGLGFGVSTLDLPSTISSTAFSGDGSSTLFDLRTRAAWHASRRFSLFAEAGFITASHELSGDSADITIEQSGLLFGLGVSWRFSDLPSRLE